MSNNTVLLSRPVKSGCNFNAVGNPIVYKLQRQDALIASVANNGGNLQMIISAVDLTSFFQVGNTVYVGMNEYAAPFVITASVLDTGDTKITVGTPYVGGGTGYLNNISKRTDYKVEVEVFDAATNVALGPRLSFDYDSTGTVYADVAGIVRAYVKAEWQKVTGDDDIEALTSKKFYVKYQEFFDITYWETISDVANPVVGVFAVLNLLQFSPPNFTRYPHGGNLLGYFPGAGARKWLTRFNTAVMWRGYPFTMSVLWSIANKGLFIKQYNGAGEIVFDGSTPLAETVGNVVRLQLEDVVATATKMVIYLENSGVKLLEDFTIEVRDPCENPVLLFWKNSLGGDAFWMFDESQDYTYAASSGNKVRRMVLYADNLNVDQWDALNELNSLSDVFQLNIQDYAMDNSIDKTHYRDDNQVYIITATGEKVGVIVVNNDNKTRTLNRKHSIQLTIELPALYAV